MAQRGFGWRAATIALASPWPRWKSSAQRRADSFAHTTLRHPPLTPTPTVTLRRHHRRHLREHHSDANGDPIADRHAQSDAAATPDTVSSADALTRSWNSLWGNSRKKLASSRDGANALNLRALSEGRIACSGKCESCSDRWQRNCQTRERIRRSRTYLPTR